MTYQKFCSSIWGHRSDVQEFYSRKRVPRGQWDGSLRPYSRLSRPQPLLFFSISFSIVLTRLSGPRSRPTTSQKIWLRRESNLAFWICSHELWSLDHRGWHTIIDYPSHLYGPEAWTFLTESRQLLTFGHYPLFCFSLIYFEKMKVVLWDLHAVCMSNPQPIFTKFFMFIVEPESISAAYFIISSHQFVSICVFSFDC
jgi:hypothetical protein